MLLHPQVATFPGYFDIDEIETIKNFCIHSHKVFGTTGGDGNDMQRNEVKRTGSLARKSLVFFIDRKTTFVCEPFVKYDSLISYVENKYFNIGIGDLDEWEGYQFTEYSQEYQGFYRKHTDVGGKELRGRKLSASLQLTEESEYEGGDLIIYSNKDIIKCPRQQGTMTIFHSTMLHEVTPVTSGLRQSLVTWVS